MVAWVDAIAELAEENWRNNSVVFLARIPDFLKEKGLDPKEIVRGRSLRLAISIDGAGRLQLLSDPNNPLVWAVVPASVNLPEDLSPLFQRKEAVHSFTGPRFKGWFWKAFIRPLPAGTVRYVKTDGCIDIPAAEPVPSDGIQVLPDDIVQFEPGYLNNDAVLGRIRAWASRSGVNLQTFYFSPPSAALQSLEHKNVLPKLSSLDTDDLKRIMVPLDIVLKLLR